VLLQAVPADLIARMFAGRFAWLICLLAFMGVAWIANSWAMSGASPAVQYLGLGLYVVAEAGIFLPVLYVGATFPAPHVIPKAAILTLTVFAGLTSVVFMTRHDFSYLRTILFVRCFVALGIVLVAIFMGGGLGLWFSAAMVLLACGFILYDTS